jgi:hypothetical protein
MKGIKRSLVDYFGRIVCRLYEMGSWVMAGFSDRTPYPWESEAMGVRSEKSAGVAI